jgi:ATP-dependent Clp protease ATP-binding subunit ClpA
MELLNAYKNLIRNFFVFWINLFIFFAYFFSVSQLFKTLFSPWKNLVFEKTEEGFSFLIWIESIFINLFSRLVGAIMRLTLLSFYFLLQFFLIIIFPFSLVYYLLISPLLLLIQRSLPDEKTKKLYLKKRFIENHLISETNLELVEKWFDQYYEQTKKKSLWEIKDLFNFPPLARDWSYGYTYYLNQFAEELTNPTYLKQLSPFFDRENEIQQIEKILTKSFEANILLLGEPGVGKHAVVDALASRIYYGNCHPKLAYHRILKLNMEQILAKFDDIKKREIFFESLLEEAKKAKNIIILIDNIERYLSSINQEFVDLSSIIEKFARSSEIQFVGITTPFNFERFIHPNERINRLFEKIYVQEVNKELALTILLNLVPYFEKKYSLFIPYETIKAIIEKSSFYFTEIPFPEKAINLLDEVCNYAQLKKMAKIDSKIVDLIIEQKAHVPTRLTPSLKEKLLNCASYLKENIFAQDEAVEQLALALQRAFILIGKRKKPLASFLFLGPTGVGKTETAKILSQYLFNSDNLLLRFDMSLYQSKSDINKLIGDITTNTPGLLSQQIRKNPYGVLLLDEIDKADQDLLNIFLTILDEGYFIDGFGKKVNCKNLIIIATSNAGADLIYERIKSEGLSFSWSVFQKRIIDYIIENHIFTPEFINRFDGLVVYQPLNYQVITLVAKKFLKKIVKNIFDAYQVKLKVSDQYLHNLIKNIYTPEFGARQMERIIKENIENKIANLILKGKIKQGEEIVLN